MNIKNTLLITAFSSALLACGGGSSQGVSESPESLGSAVFYMVKSKSGKYQINLTEDKSKPNVIETVELDENDTQSIIVDGSRINLSDDSKVGMFADLKGMLIGEYRHPGKDEHFLFTVGTLTRNMPVAGTANYKGKSFGYIADDGKYRKLAEGALFNVDFGNKKITGKVAYYDIKADIIGNVFRGDNLLDENIKDGKKPYQYIGKVHIEGGFYGQDAAKMAGSFASTGVYTEKDKNPVKEESFGVFGAEKK